MNEFDDRDIDEKVDNVVIDPLPPNVFGIYTKHIIGTPIFSQLEFTLDGEFDTMYKDPSVIEKLRKYNKLIQESDEIPKEYKIPVPIRYWPIELYRYFTVELEDTPPDYCRIKFDLTRYIIHGLKSIHANEELSEEERDIAILEVVKFNYRKHEIVL
jgi:hypothetical protein